MINQLIKLLNRKGYQLFELNTGGVYVRETDDCVYLLILSIWQGFTKEHYEAARQNIEFKVVTRCRKSVTTLNLIVNRDGMFDDELVELASSLPDTWLLAGDTGRIYVYENQPDQFDGDLREYLEDNLFQLNISVNKPIFKDLPFQPTLINSVFILLNIIAFAAVIFIHHSYYAVYDTDVMLEMGALSYDTLMEGRWYELLTSMFLHFGLGHLFNNMLLLAYAGSELEKRIGSLFYCLLYMGSGIVGNLASFWYYHLIGEDSVVSAGASGAIFGVVGGLIAVLIFNHEKNDSLTPRRLVFMAGITLYNGLATAGIDNAAHIGGFCFGLFGGFLLSKILSYGKINSGRPIYHIFLR